MAELVEMPVWGTDSYVGPKNPVLDGVEIPHRKGQFLALSGPLKSIGSLCCGVYSCSCNSWSKNFDERLHRRGRGRIFHGDNVI